MFGEYGQLVGITRRVPRVRPGMRDGLIEAIASGGGGAVVRRRLMGARWRRGCGGPGRSGGSFVRRVLLGQLRE